MNFDTLRFTCSLNNGVSYWNKSSSRVTIHTSQAGNSKISQEPVKTYNINTIGLLGIGGKRNYGIEIYPEQDLAVIEWSSKILYEDYYKHINNTTLMQVIDNFNKALRGHIGLNPPEIVNNAKIKRVDIVQDNEMVEAIRRRICLSLRRNPKDGYILEPQGKGKQTGNGLVIKPNGDNCLRFTLYDKFSQMMTAKERPTSIKYLDPYTHFVDVTRSELKLTSRPNVRKYLDIKTKGEIHMSEIINSKAKPLSTFINTVSQVDQDPLIEELYADRVAKEKGWEKQQKLIRAIEIIRQYNYSIPQIRAAMKPHYASKQALSNALKEAGYKELISYIRRLDDNEISLLENYIAGLDT